MTDEGQFEIIIVGAGAVGLLLANLLGRQGLSVLLLEKAGQVRSGSRAIGISPPSLEILKKVHLDEAFLQAGVKVRQAVVHGSKRILGKVVFDALPSPYPFILSLPQERAENLLENHLQQYPAVTLLRNREAVDVRTNPHQVQVEVIQHQDKIPATYSARFLCVCEGKNSTLRERLQIPFVGGRYRQTFLMADFHDTSDFGHDAHLFFTHRGPVESFPLPEKKRRWIVDTPAYMAQPEPGYLEAQVWQRAGVRLDAGLKISETPFGVQHYQAAAYFQERVILCGDAAHVMSPIGGQGMNTGFGDAEFCASMLAHAIKWWEPKEVPFWKYQHYRRQASEVATRRAAWSMAIGTIKGSFWSGLRNSLLKPLLRLLKTQAPIYFSMLSIPYHTLDLVLKKDESPWGKPEGIE